MSRYLPHPQTAEVGSDNQRVTTVVAPASVGGDGGIHRHLAGALDGFGRVSAGNPGARPQT